MLFPVYCTRITVHCCSCFLYACVLRTLIAFLSLEFAHILLHPVRISPFAATMLGFDVRNKLTRPTIRITIPAKVYSTYKLSSFSLFFLVMLL